MKIIISPSGADTLIAGKTYYTTPDIAKMMGRTPQSVRNWIETGKLATTRVGNVYFVSEEDFIDNVPAYMREPKLLKLNKEKQNARKNRGN